MKKEFFIRHQRNLIIAASLLGLYLIISIFTLYLMNNGSSNYTRIPRATSTPFPTTAPYFTPTPTLPNKLYYHEECNLASANIELYGTPIAKNPVEDLFSFYHYEEQEDGSYKEVLKNDINNYRKTYSVGKFNTGTLNYFKKDQDDKIVKQYSVYLKDKEIKVVNILDAVISFYVDVYGSNYILNTQNYYLYESLKSGPNTYCHTTENFINIYDDNAILPKISRYINTSAWKSANGISFSYLYYNLIPFSKLKNVREVDMVSGEKIYYGEFENENLYFIKSKDGMIYSTQYSISENDTLLIDESVITEANYSSYPNFPCGSYFYPRNKFTNLDISKQVQIGTLNGRPIYGPKDINDKYINDFYREMVFPFEGDQPSEYDIDIQTFFDRNPYFFYVNEYGHTLIFYSNNVSDFYCD